MSIRGNFNIILYAGQLFQHYLVDSYIKAEGNRLRYLREHQADLHVAKYNGLMDFLNNRAERENLTVGTTYILPSSFIGSPRAMQQAYQDSMAICAKFGKPTFFLTFTCNPKWTEITNSIPSYHSASDRPDVVARVYNLKKNEMIEDIQKRQVLGAVTARIHVIEFQKRGLPHCHMLIWIDEPDIPTTSADIDRTIHAEIPNKETHPRLYEIIMSNMIHGPCGKDLNDKSPCMDDGQCTKSFPKEFVPETLMSNNGFPTYRRRDNGQTHPLKRNNKIYQVDNRWVVPYNPYLCLKYNSHINLEYCASIKSIKYLFKYVHKGFDCMETETITGTQGAQDAKEQGPGSAIKWDEITQFQDNRYVSAPEAFWRLSKFPSLTNPIPSNDKQFIFHEKSQSSSRLGLEQQTVDKAASKNTTLTAWFNLNRTHPAARDMFYREIPQHFVFNGTWKPRKKKTNVLSRIYSVSIRQIERFCLRLLLLSVKGATSFESLKTHDGVVHPTFK